MALVRINREWCKPPCEICVASCAKNVLATDEKMYPVVIDEEACNKCMLCELRCPMVAIEIYDELAEIEKEVEKNGQKNLISRK